MSADVIKHNDLAFNYEINDFLQKRQIQITYNYIRSPLLSCVYSDIIKIPKNSNNSRIHVYTLLKPRIHGDGQRQITTCHTYNQVEKNSLNTK